MTARDRLHAAYTARHFVPDGPGTPVGIVTQAVPLELILAAGLRPIRLFGDPLRPPEVGDRYMEEELDGEVRSLFDRLLRGEFAGLPLVLLPRVSEQHLQLHYYLAEARRWEPAAAIPPVEIVDVMQTAYWSTGRYVRARLDALRSRLAALDHAFGDDALLEAIATVNAMRRALQALNARRREGLLRGSDMLRITALYGALSPADFLALCADLAAEPAEPAAGPRLMLSGSLQDDPGLAELAESLGAHVAADDHVAGERVFAHLVDEAMDPMEALAEHYQVHAPGLRQFPQGPQDDRFVATCRDARVDADLCVLESGDDTLGWDWPGRRDRLAAHGIASALLPGQDYFRPDRQAQADAIRALLREPAV